MLNGSAGFGIKVQEFGMEVLGIRFRSSEWRYSGYGARNGGTQNKVQELGMEVLGIDTERITSRMNLPHQERQLCIKSLSSSTVVDHHRTVSS